MTIAQGKIPPNPTKTQYKAVYDATEGDVLKFQNFHSSWKNVSRNLAASGAVLGSTGLRRSAALRIVVRFVVGTLLLLLFCRLCCFVVVVVVLLLFRFGYVVSSFVLFRCGYVVVLLIRCGYVVVLLCHVVAVLLFRCVVF